MSVTQTFLQSHTFIENKKKVDFFLKTQYVIQVITEYAP